ncbi:hypothetical protein C448_00962 [Halococcus morrhuae DSM 1307]|uniref:Uncharacterized protein n=1 Tax=Halococcus morrhuae DSM 1307 TaxID=931277 RepID=M0N1F1_HALMO|nr:DUF5787 family protein [Halococcus morrhuae]EMA51368.1 hypothetical protein C448_00962 [Halococcus morrhuae DSM 1307]
MREFAFELALCARLEADIEGIVSRQLSTSLNGNRVMDIVHVEPGPDFDARAQLTPHEIPDAAIESNVGVGTARYWKDAFDCHPERARTATDRAIEIGFFERERRGGREYVRQTARYPDDWFGKLVGIENKPDLGRPGDLEAQLRRDVSLGLLDEVILATASHVTGAHLHRIPDEVGVWRFDPDQGIREVLREPTTLSPTECGIDIGDRRPTETAIEPVGPAAKARARRRIAERAYGKGWRIDDFPHCAQVEDGEYAGARGMPYCEWKGRFVHPAAECGVECAGHEPGAPPDVDVDAERDRRSSWVADPDGRQRRQAGLDRF